MAILRPSRIFGLVNQDETTAEGDVATWDAARASYEPRPASGGSMVPHDIVGGYHTGSGLTAGHVLRASAPTAFAFAAIQDADIPATIARDTEVSGAITAHEGAADPHAGYQKESEKAAANGYASLDAGVKVPVVQIPDLSGTYALSGAGVTGGNAHDHAGGDGAQIAHTSLSSIGTNAHSVIDTHLASTSNPHSVTAAQAGALATAAFVGLAKITVGTSAPVGPSTGDLFVDTT